MSVSTHNISLAMKILARGGWFHGALRRERAPGQQAPSATMSRVGDLYTVTTTQDCEVAKHLVPQRILVLASGLLRRLAAAHWQMPGRAAFMKFRTEKGCTS